MVGQGAQYHLLVNNSNDPNSSQGSGDHYRFSNGSTGGGAGAASGWDRSRSSSQRLSNSPRNSMSNTHTTVYYPGQTHPHFLPGDEAL